jgi:hypothetical protein
VDNIIQQSNDGNSVITPREQSENNEPDIDFANNSDEDQKLKVARYSYHKNPAQESRTQNRVTIFTPGSRKLINKMKELPK